MNRIYRLIWNAVSGVWQAVCESARGRGKTVCGQWSRMRLERSAASLATLAVLGSLASPQASAAPLGGQVVSGNGSIGSAGTTTTITQSSATLSLTWQSFNIAAPETVTFVQPSAASIAVNRIFDTNGTQIHGRLNANGQVYLINPNGILFGAGAQVNVGGLVASTLDLAESTLGSASQRFAGSGMGSIENHGTINAASGGYVAFLGQRVSNAGTISAPQGSVALGAGSAATLTFAGNRLLQLQVEPSTLESLVENQGLIRAEGGQVILSAGARNSVLAGVVNNTGLIEARSVEHRNGVIVLEGRQIEHTGTLDASAAADLNGNDAVSGGSIGLSGNLIFAGGVTNASGADGGSITVEAHNLLQAGTMRAEGTLGQGGTIALHAGGGIIQTTDTLLSVDAQDRGGSITLRGETGGVFSSGTLSANGGSNGSATSRGGRIEIVGPQLALAAARIAASGDAAGGTILIGGDLQGKNPDIANARTLTVNGATEIQADARIAGPGGKLILWSDEATEFYGTVSARGGAQGGNGGFIEVSGKQDLIYGGTANAGAPHGTPGTLLLDPKNITISDAGVLPQFRLIDPTADIGGNFGTTTLALSTGNIVVTDPLDDFGSVDAGAVYLFDGKTGALISTLTGSHASDGVGTTITPLIGNGNFVVASTSWDNGTASNAGAATWINGTTGLSGTVSAANSLVGSTAGDFVGNGLSGFDGITPLINGNYVVGSSLWTNFVTGRITVGAATWGNGAGGIVGAVSPANSLVGGTAGDLVGYGGVLALSNGNYTVSSPYWRNGGLFNAGAVTWGNGAIGGTRTVGLVSAANSLVGGRTNDMVGTRVTALTNGNYVVASPNWDRSGTVTNVGAVTWGNGLGGTVGVVSAANSLIGSATGDYVGANGVVALTNGNYVVSSGSWRNGAAASAGAVTWGNGLGGTVGAVSAANSLVGTNTNDHVGDAIFLKAVTALSNGNYVVNSLVWRNGSLSGAGAVTWGNGLGGTVGAVSTTNSLYGTRANDNVGSGGVTALSNGNYVVGSSSWDNGAIANAGAATWGNGLGGTVGAVSTTNSLYGTRANDNVGSGGVTALTNGNYVVSSPNWTNGSVLNTGAATWGNGLSGTIGAVASTNSLVGSTASDNVSGFGVTALNNGHYVVQSAFWDNGTIADAGAATWGNGLGGTTGAVSASNSLLGSTANDYVSSGGVTALANGNYVVNSPGWASGALTAAGAATWSSGTDGKTIDGSSIVTAQNSLIGTAANAGMAKTVEDSVNSTFVTPFKTDVRGRVRVGLTDLNLLTYERAQTSSMTINWALLRKTLDSGTAVALQANNDITVGSTSLVSPPVASGGALSLAAGRSILINGNIRTDNAAINLTANAPGIVASERDPGAAVITMAPGTTLSAGTGNITLTVGPGSGTDTTSGNITVNNLTTTGHVLIANNGPTAGSSIVRAQASSLVRGSSAAFDVNGAGGGGRIGDAANPLRVTVGNLSARSQSGGAFFSSPDLGITLGGAALGGLTGISTSGDGDATITAVGGLTQNQNISLGNGRLTLAGSRYVNNVGAGALSAGRWLVYSANPALDTRNGLDYAFKQYNAPYATAPAQASGNGFLYSIAPTITAGLTGTVTKVYDGTNTATLAAANFGSSGQIDGDSITLSAGSASYSDKHVGVGKQVTATGVTMSASNGADAVYGYQLASTTAVGNIGTITPAALAVTGLVANDKVYDGTPLATLSGTPAVTPLGSDGVSVAGVGSGLFADPNVGVAKPVTVSGYTLAGVDAPNYSIVQPVGLGADIFAVIPPVTPPSPSPSALSTRTRGCFADVEGASSCQGPLQKIKRPVLATSGSPLVRIVDEGVR